MLAWALSIKVKGWGPGWPGPVDKSEGFSWAGLAHGPTIKVRGWGAGLAQGLTIKVKGLGAGLASQ